MADFRPDPLTAGAELLAAALQQVQREYRFASHEFDLGRTPDGCDEVTVAWWRLAYECWQRAGRDPQPARR